MRLRASGRSGRLALRRSARASLDTREGQGLADRDLADARARAWYASGSWVLTGEEKERPVRAEAEVRSRGSRGALRASVVRQRGRGGAALRNPRADKMLPSGEHVLTVGINWYIARWVKLQFQTMREQPRTRSVARCQGARPSGVRSSDFKSVSEGNVSARPETEGSVMSTMAAPVARRATLVAALFVACVVARAQAVPPVVLDPTAEFFDDSVLHELRLWINSRDWETLKTNFLSNDVLSRRPAVERDDGAERRDSVARQRQPKRLQARPAGGHRSLRDEAEVPRHEVVRAA